MTDVPQIITRAEAKAAGLKRYFTGEPCRHRHVDERRVSNGCCIACTAVYMVDYHVANAEHIRTKVRDYVQRNREQVRAYKKAHRIANFEKLAEFSRQWRIDNAEHRKVNAHRYHLANAEKIKARVVEWQKKNPEKVRAFGNCTRAKRSAAEGFHTHRNIKDLLKMQKCRCAICKVSLKDGYHVDHIIPLARGGSNWPANLQLLCAPCNMKKGARDPIDHMQSLGFLL